MNGPGACRGIVSRVDAVLTSMAIAVLLIAGCANPVPPTGGPADSTPPEIRTSMPADQATRVSANDLRIEFSEYVDQASFARAFSITPAFAEPVDISWRGRTVTIRFPEPLRPNTTYIVQIDTNLRDAHGVSVRNPISIAFSTGEQIDQGTLSGRVVSEVDGAPVPSIDVFAYRDLDPDTLRYLPPAPDYRTQTGTDGRFTFRYLPEGASFYVVAMADANRNRTLEPGERYAVPPTPALRADTSLQAHEVPWITTLPDALAPEPQRVRQLSSRRVGIRFSEPIHLASLDEWVVTDSTTGTRLPATGYVSPSDPREVIAMFDSLAPGTYHLSTPGIADSAGNVVREVLQPFEIAPIRDTLTVHFVGFEPDTAEVALVPPGSHPRVAFSAGLTEAEVRERLEVTDTLGTPLEFQLRTTTRTRWEVTDAGLGSGDVIVVRVQDPASPDTVFVQRFRSLPLDQTGEISGVVRSEVHPVVVEVYAQDGRNPVRVRARATGEFLARQLPAGAYFVRAYADRDSSASWTGGRLAPYDPPEPMNWYPDSVRVRVRWETALEDTLSLIPTKSTPERP